MFAFIAFLYAGICGREKKNGLFILTGNHQLVLHETIGQDSTAIIIYPEIKSLKAYDHLDQIIWMSGYPKLFSATMDVRRY